MKRQSRTWIGNTMMFLGLITMAGSVLTAMLSAAIHLDEFYSQAAVMGIFIGALLWLFGALLGGKEAVADRYWWIRHFDKRCKRKNREK